MKESRYDGDFTNLLIHGEFSDFPEFYKTNKDIIFKNIIQIYNEISVSNRDSFDLIIKSVINNEEYNSKLDYSLKDKDILPTLILPFFEEQEEYEICSKIVKIMERLENCG